MLTEKEKRLFNALGDDFVLFCELLEVHPSDKPEFAFHIHALQNIVLSRPTLAAIKEESLSEKSETNKLNR